MTSVSGVTVAARPVAAAAPAGPVSVAKALATLQQQPGSTLAISDSLVNIQSNLDALQSVAARITSLTTTDQTARLSVSAAQYTKDAGVLARWGATDGNTVDVTAVTAANAASFASSRASWVSSFSVSDSAANLSRQLDSLQSLVADGSLRQIVRTGSATALKITSTQLAADAGALGAIQNQAYTLTVTNASVSETLGLEGKTALTANAKIQSIQVKDTTAAIEQNLDSLQRLGLKLKSISQTDADTALKVSASQYKNDAIAIGKILTPYHLDVMRASASQVSALAADAKVQSVSVSDTAANIARRWSLLDRLGDSLSAVEVTDGNNAIALTADQAAVGDKLLAKFTVDSSHTYNLAVKDARAGQAAEIAALGHVASVSISDSAANVATSLASLQTLNGQGLLKSVSLTGKSLNLSLDAAQMLGDAAASTQGVLDKIANLNYGVAVAGATTDTLDALAAKTRVVSIALGASSDQIGANLDKLGQLGGRLSRIVQSDSGAVIGLTQTAFDRRAGVLAKIQGGYLVSISGATAGQAQADASNGHVASVSVVDSGRNLAQYWRALRSMGNALTSVTKSDTGALALSATGYQLAQADGLLAKFAADQHYSLSNASVAQSLQLGSESAVDRIDIVDDGDVVATQISDLTDLASGGKLHAITLNAGARRIALQASQLSGAQSVLGLVSDGRYSLALDQVAAADLGTLLAGNTKIASVTVTADAAGIASNLSALAAAGSKLTAIARTDAADVALALTGADFDSHRGELAKISDGYLVDLTAVTAGRAASVATNSHVKSIKVADTAAHLSAAWDGMSAIGSKLTEVAQSDSAQISLTASQWARTQSLGAKFSTTLKLGIASAGVADLASLDADSAVQSIQVSDNAATISAGWSSLAADTKLTRLTVTNPTTALTLSAATYAASTTLRGLIEGDQYTTALSDVSVADAATLAADTHVATLDVGGSSSDISAAFDTLAGLAKLTSLTLNNEDGTLSLTAAQVLGNTATLAKISNGYQIDATAATLADLPTLKSASNLASIGVSDSAANVADQLDDLTALGGLLGSVHLTDASPLLALKQSDWSDGATVLAKIDGSYGVALSEVDPGAAANLTADSTVQQISAAGTAESVVQNWSSLVAAYDAGAGKLMAITVTDSAPLSLSAAQQNDGAAMITGLLSGATVVTV